MMNWTVSQLGRRQHYAIARAMLRRGRLTRLYTDAWVDRLRPLLRKAPGALKALSTRHHKDLPNDMVVSFTARALYEAFYDRAFNPGRTPEGASRRTIQIGRQFSRATARHLLKRPIDPARDAFFGFNTSSLDVLRALRDRGVLTVLDQVDPAKTEEDIVVAEAEKWPGWELAPGRADPSYWAHMQEEWATATVVYVNSNWSRSALLKQGVPAEKIVVVPIAFESPVPAAARQRPRNLDRSKPLIVLWLGSVSIRKGIPYLIEAARRLKDVNIRFEVVGPVWISDKARAEAPANMSFPGRAIGEQVAAYYRQADVFVLPTISDGFAITQLEAMSHGLPVITTPHCGEVVEPGKDGLIVPAGDAEALAAGFARLEADRALVAEMSRNALEKVGCFTLDRVANALDEIAQTRRPS